MEPDPLQCLAGAAVAGFDHEARSFNAPCWSSSLPYYRQAQELIAELSAANRRLKDILTHLARTPAPREMYHPLLAELSSLGNPADTQRVRAVGQDISDRIRLFYFETSHMEPLVPPAAGAKAPHIHVVIPFRSAPGQHLRTRNLQACLSALRRQGPDREDLTVTLVESDELPRHRDTFIDLVDSYLFHQDGGLFNKALTVNTGATVRPARDDLLCILDADIVVDPGFVTRISRTAPRTGAFLPYTDAFCLDADSSDRWASRRRPDRQWSGYLLRRPPGGCIVVDRGSFDAVGGFDTRFVGWGGEDRDLVNRLQKLAPVVRSPGLLLHLMHERPPMRESREEIMRTALGA